MAKLIPGGPTFFTDHVPVYLETRGHEGHFPDIRQYGGTGPTTMLILKTIGRRTGQERLTALIYDNIGSDYVIIGSTSGAPKHPAWFLNLAERAEVEFQVADKCFRGSWRVAEGQERTVVWDKMVDYFPPYADYQTRTSRQIPVILLSPTVSIPALHHSPI